MKLLLMGPQGCGKGTIGEMLSDKLDIPLISVGEMLRNVPPSHPRYKELTSFLNRGLLSPQDLVAELLKERVLQPDCANGFIFDGWGRKKIDLEYFDPGFDKVILLEISPETSILRLSNRRTCRKCGKVFNLITVPPKKEGVCDECGGELYQRDDDTKEAINTRLSIFYHDTQEVLQIFKKRGILIEIDGEPAPEVVFQSVMSALKK